MMVFGWELGGIGVCGKGWVGICSAADVPWTQGTTDFLYIMEYGDDIWAVGESGGGSGW